MGSLSYDAQMSVQEHLERDSQVRSGRLVSPRSRAMLFLCLLTMIITVLVSMCLCIFHGTQSHVYRVVYLMLGIGLIGLVAIQMILIALIKKGDLVPEKTKGLVFIGLLIIVEAVLTTLILYN